MPVSQSIMFYGEWEKIIPELSPNTPDQVNVPVASLWGWLGEAKMLRILHHRGQLRLAYYWARHAILAAGKGREEMFLFLQFLHFLYPV